MAVSYEEPGQLARFNRKLDYQPMGIVWPELCCVVVRSESRCFRRLFRWACFRWFSRLSEQVADRAVNEPELCDVFRREASIAIVDQGGLLPQKCQLAFQSIDAATKRISFSDDALNCTRWGEEQAFNVLDGVRLDLSGRVRCFSNRDDVHATHFSVISLQWPLLCLPYPQGAGRRWIEAWLTQPWRFNRKLVLPANWVW
jgi:hypothetical protein